MLMQASKIQTNSFTPLKSNIMHDNQGFVAVMFFLTFFGSIFGIAYFYYTTRNRERLALIEKNADASIFKIEPVTTFKKSSLKVALLFLGGRHGVLLGTILTV